MFTYALVLLFSVAGSFQADLPSSVTKCKAADGACLAKSAKQFKELFGPNGNKQLNVPSIHPIYVERVLIPGNGGKGVDLQQEYKNMKIFWYDSTFENFKVDLDKCTFHYELVSPHVELLANHHFTGKLLVFQLNGFGKANITLEDFRAFADFTCSKEAKKGKTYLKINDFKLKMQPKKLFYDLDNVIDGNPELSAEVLKVANENSFEIYEEIRHDYDQTIGEVMRQYIQGLFNVVPIENLFAT